MMSPLRVVPLLLVPAAAFVILAQIPSATPPNSEPAPETRLPNGRLQRDEILKADHAKSLDDAQTLIRLSEELKAGLEKNTEYVFSLATIKKTEEIEKVARRIRSRLKRN
jgi:hypothetical protein